MPYTHPWQQSSDRALKNTKTETPNSITILQQDPPNNASYIELRTSSFSTCSNTTTFKEYSQSLETPSISLHSRILSIATSRGVSPRYSIKRLVENCENFGRATHLNQYFDSTTLESRKLVVYGIRIEWSIRRHYALLDRSRWSINIWPNVWTKNFDFLDFWNFLVTVGRIAPNKVSTDSPENSLSVDTEFDCINRIY